MSQIRPINMTSTQRNLTIVAGVVLLVLGGHQLKLGWYKRPLAELTQAAVSMDPISKQVQDQRLFRLRFDPDYGNWFLAATLDETYVGLPNGFPEPPTWEPPARPMSMVDWAEYMGSQLQSGRLILTAATIDTLAAISVEDERPFSSLARVSGRAAVKPEKPESVLVRIPGELDPTSPVFERQMQAWRQRVREGLRGAPVTRQGYRFKATHPSMGNRRQLVVSSIARARILSREFGRKKQDIIIYLQVLCNFHKVFLKIDGVSGPQTRKGIDAMAFLVFADEKTRGIYRRKLRPWIGK